LAASQTSLDGLWMGSSQLAMNNRTIRVFMIDNPAGQNQGYYRVGAGTTDIVLYQIDNPLGLNQGFYKIGKKCDVNGHVQGDGAFGPCFPDGSPLRMPAVA
jgi:hypothetical protein